jgi:hypothetical protein
MKRITTILLISIIFVMSDDLNNGDTYIIKPGVSVGHIKIGCKYDLDTNSESIIVLQNKGRVDYIFCKDKDFQYNGVNLIGLSKHEFLRKFPLSVKIKNSTKIPKEVSYKVTNGLYVNIEDGIVTTFCVYSKAP